MKKQNETKTIKTSLSGGNLTNYSGIYPLFKFIKEMRLNHLFEQKISLAEKSNQNYSLSKILNAVILGTLSGMNRLIKIENFTLDPLMRHLLDIKS